MATRRATGGIAHPTVVPENFDPDEESGDDEEAESVLDRTVSEGDGPGSGE